MAFGKQLQDLFERSGRGGEVMKMMKTDDAKMHLGTDWVSSMAPEFLTACTQYHPIWIEANLKKKTSGSYRFHRSYTIMGLNWRIPHQCSIEEEWKWCIISTHYFREKIYMFEVGEKKTQRKAGEALVFAAWITSKRHKEMHRCLG